MSTMAVELARVSGGKNLIWVTDGVPIELGPNRSDTGDFVDYTPLLRQMSEALDRSGVAIYPVRQVMLGSPGNVNGSNRRGIESIDTLSPFAELTGGCPDAGKDIGAALRLALSDMRTSYQIGYAPANLWDNKFHKLRVTTTRKKVKLQAKAGYYAWQESDGARAEQAFNTAMQTEFDAAEIGIRGRLSPRLRRECRPPRGAHRRRRRRADFGRRPLLRTAAARAGRLCSRRAASGRPYHSARSPLHPRGARASASRWHPILTGRHFSGTRQRAAS